ncbi:MAG: ATP synthase F1 subunit epsilon [Acidimicrobiia bacterium]
MAELVVSVVSPESILFEGEAEMVVCRPVEGEIAFLPGHEPFVGALGGFPVRIIRSEGQPEIAIAVHGGFVEFSDDRVTVLSDAAELPEQIDVVRAQTAKDDAERRLNENPEDLVAIEALTRANLRLEAAQGFTRAT